MNNQTQANQITDQSVEDTEEQNRVTHFLLQSKEFDEDKTPIIRSEVIFDFQLKS